jgi:hypothetical protein
MVKNKYKELNSKIDIKEENKEKWKVTLIVPLKQLLNS